MLIIEKLFTNTIIRGFELDSSRYGERGRDARATAGETPALRIGSNKLIYAGFDDLTDFAQMLVSIGFES